MNPPREHNTRPPACHGEAPRTPAERELAESMLERLKAGLDLRVNKVRRIRRSIRARTYENGLKIEIALDRLRAQFRPFPRPRRRDTMKK